MKQRQNAIRTGTNGSTRVARSLALVAATVLFAGVVLADEDAEGWKPDVPTPVDFDWIQLVSDEWLKGELIAMYDGELEFDSDEMDLQTFDWGDVKQVRSWRVVQVRFVDDTKAVGQVIIDEKTVRVLGEPEQQFDRVNVLTMIVGEPKERNYWSGKVTFGLNIRDGNTEQVEMNASARVLRRTAKNRIVMDYIGNAGTTFDVETENNHRVTLAWDRFLSKRLFVTPASFEYFRDPFQNISHRETFSVGVGYHIIDTPKTALEVSGGPGYQQTKFDSVPAGESETDTTPAFTVTTLFDHEITKAIDFVFEYRFQITNEEAGSYNHHMLTGFETEITKMLDLDLSFVWDRIKNPRPTEDGSVPLPDDYRLIVAVGFDF